MARVLVIEDDADVRVMLANALRLAGHGAVIASSGRSGLELTRSAGPELVLLDLQLPDMPGLGVLSALKTDLRTERIPVIILSARTAESDRVTGFELGAEDFVTKPFSVRELMLRAAVALRRASATVQPPLPETVACGPIQIETAGHRAFVDGRPVPLTPIEFRLLRVLTERADRVQSREVLLADVWGMVAELETRTVDAHIKRLREKLGEAGNLVETVRGVGYRFRKMIDAS